MATNTAAKSTTPPAQRDSKPVLLKVNLAQTKETKGAVRYDAPQNEADRIGGPLNIYFRKESMKEFPPHITVTVTALA